MSITSTSCKTLVTDASKGPVREYFALVHWHEDSKQFDLTLTDGHHGWTASGCSITHPLHVSNEEAWARCKLALSDITQHNQSATEHIVWTSEQTNKADSSRDQLQLIWGWGSSLHGREVMRVVPWLDKETDGAAIVRDFMRHMLTSHTLMKTAVMECQAAQQQLERSLAEKEALLKHTAEAQQEQEKLLFTKFAMLLNKKTERIVQLTETLQQQSQKLERLQGSDQQDTDDEAREAAAIYEAETEDDSDDEQQQLHLHGTAAAGQLMPPQQQQQQQGSSPADGVSDALQTDSHHHQQQQGVDAGCQAAKVTQQVDPGGAQYDDQATQPLDADVRAVLDMQHKQQLQRRHGTQQQPASAEPAPVQSTNPASVVGPSAGSTQQRTGGVKRRIAR